MTALSTLTNVEVEYADATECPYHPIISPTVFLTELSTLTRVECKDVQLQSNSSITIQ